MRKVSMMMMIVEMKVILSQRMTFLMENVKLTVLTTMLEEFPDMLSDMCGMAEVLGMVVAEDAVGIDQGVTPPRMD